MSWRNTTKRMKTQLFLCLLTFNDEPSWKRKRIKYTTFCRLLPQIHKIKVDCATTQPGISLHFPFMWKVIILTLGSKPPAPTSRAHAWKWAFWKTQSEGVGGWEREKSSSNQDPSLLPIYFSSNCLWPTKSFVLPSYSSSGPQQLPYPHFTKKSGDGKAL